MTMQEFLAGLAIINTALLTGFGVAIAHRQAQTAKNKFRLDLFDRRYVIYQAVMEYVEKFNAQGHIVRSDWDQLERETRGARWLFSDLVANYISVELGHVTGDFWEELYHMQQESLGEDVMPSTARHTEIVVWFAGQPEAIDRLFGPFLSQPE